MQNILMPLTDIQFLLSHLQNDNLKQALTKMLNDAHIVKQRLYSTGKFNLAFTDSQISLVLDELSYLLTDIGLDEQDEPNEIGHSIEKLIDVFTSRLKQ